ncbi:MAG TPA: lyase family protein [Marisediminicola sp.]|nr:lyase family protein [Marisediminicola sp.]
MPDDQGLLDPLANGTRATELTRDSAFLQAMVDAELGLTLALIDAGLVPGWMGAVCEQLADASRLDLAAIAAEGRAGGNPVIPLVKHLGARAETFRSGASDHLHVGATSQDILDTATMLVTRRVAGEMLAQLGTLADGLAVLADQHRATPMVGRTLGQHASPTSFGFVAASWLDAVLQAKDRLAAERASLPIQLGGAVGTLAVLSSIASERLPDSPPAQTIDLVLGLFARRLGLAEPVMPWHTNRLVVTGIASALAAATGAVGAFALDVTVLSRTEIGELSERLSPGEGGSSAMPHKRNPVTAVLVTAAARQTPALLATLYSSLLAEGQRPSGAWHAEWAALRTLESVAVAAVTGAVDLAARLDVDSGRMLANLDLTEGLVFSERVTTILAEALGKARAFDLVGRASREAYETGRPLRVVLSAYLAADSPLRQSDDDALRARVWSAFDLTDFGHSDAGIDRALRRHRGLEATINEEGTLVA